MRRIYIGARVDTGTVLTALDNISSIEIETQISEALFPNVREGMSVSAHSAAYPGRAFTGTVVAIDKRIDPVARAFRVRVRVPNKDAALPAGMFMRLSLELSKRSNPAIPEEALVVQADQKFVYVVDANEEQVARTQIEIGQRRDGLIEIIRGVQPATVIVTEGTHRLRDGAKISVKPNQPDAEPGISGEPGTPASSAKVRGKRKKDGG